MKLDFVGHAATLLRDASGAPLLATDPWLVGSCYWRSWWHENPPSQEQIAAFKQAKYVYITHEHPDHFHYPSIRAIGKEPTYLFAEQAHKTNMKFLADNGYKVKELPPRRWVELDANTKIMSVPNWNDDSALIILTPEVAVINMNDSRFSNRTKRWISKILDAFPVPRLLCQSYSAASFIFNFFHNNQRLSVVTGDTYIDMTLDACRKLGAAAFVPFASQSVFMRDDTEWANNYKIRYADLVARWDIPTQLLPCYVSVELKKGFPYQQHAVQPVPESAKAKIIEAEETGRRPIRDVDKVCKLIGRKFRLFSPYLLVAFPKGLKFSLSSGQSFIYRPFRTKAEFVEGQVAASVTFHTSTQPFYEALLYGHFNDLSISMFTRIDVTRPKMGPWMVYLLFVLLEFHDHGQFSSIRAFSRFLFKNTPRLLGLA